jgi:hypothetical protein
MVKITHKPGATAHGFAMKILSLDPGTDNSQQRPLAAVMKELRGRFGDKLKVEGTYRGAHSRLLFCCTTCGNKQTSTFYEKLKAKYGCRPCASSKVHTWTHAEFLERLAERPQAALLNVLGKYRGSQRPVKVQCRSCAHIWTPRPNNLLYSESGCPGCAKLSTTRFDFKTVSLGKRKVRVQGYEPEAIEWILAKGVAPEKIQVFSEGTVPEIPYKHKRKNRVYRPDLRVGKRIVEVKSLWTLLIALEINKAKAQACIDAGYEYRLLVSNTTKTISLGSSWLKQTAATIEQECRRRLIEPLTILALDPGSANFGWSVVQVTGPAKFRVIATGMVQNTVRELKTDVMGQVNPFVKELQGYMDEFGVNAVAIERYMTRGIGGTTIESVNFMIGVVMSLCYQRPRKRFLAIPASQWKNEFNRHSSLEQLYKDAPTCTPHQLDSVGIGVYAGYFWYGLKPYESFDKLRKKIAKDATAANQ